MDIIYYCILRLKDLEDEELIEVHAKPLLSKEDAKEFEEEAKEHFKDRLVKSRIRRTNLNNFESHMLEV